MFAITAVTKASYKNDDLTRETRQEAEDLAAMQMRNRRLKGRKP